MKKTLSALLVGSMLMFPLPALATDDTDTINSLSFEKLDEVMKENSPMILNMGDSIDEASSKLDDGLDRLKDYKGKLIEALKSQLAVLGIPYTSGMKVADLGAMPTTNPLAIPSYTQATIFLDQIFNMDTQISAMEDQENDMWKSWLQVDQGKDQTIWGAQQLYLSYFNLYDQRDDLNTKLVLLQKQLSSLQLKESLGMATHLQVIDVESQIKDLNMAIDQLTKGLDGMKGQLNVFLGQDYDTPLNLKEPVSLAQSKINAMDYEEDLEDALVQSYNVRLEEDSDKREDAERNFTLAFHNAYQDVQDKQKSLDLERYKLTNEKAKYDQAVLMNSLGLLSNLEFEGAHSQYTAQVNKVDKAEQDLLQAYMAYDWMKQGLTISATASAGSQSSGASGASTGAGF